MGELITLTTPEATAVISTKAAEVHSFITTRDGQETIWSGDLKFWANRNPTLFPIVGGLANDLYQVNGKEYRLTKHGFARYAEFRVAAQSMSEVTLELSADAGTREVYPFDFMLQVRYVLSGSRLTIHYAVENQGDDAMPFEIGMHPAFLCPVTAEKAITDYRLVFEKPETAVSTTPEIRLDHQTNLPLDNAMFSPKNAFFFGKMASDYVELTDDVTTMRVGIAGLTRLGFWKKCAEAPFVCIEPQIPELSLPISNVFREGRENLVLPAQTAASFSYYFEIR